MLSERIIETMQQESDAAAAALAAAHKAHEDATARAAEARAVFGADPSDKNRKAYRAAKDLVDEAEAVLEAVEAKAGNAASKLAAARRDAAHARLRAEAPLAFDAGWSAEIEPRVERIVDAYSRLRACVDELLPLVEKQRADAKRARTLAGELGCGLPSPVENKDLEMLRDLVRARIVEWRTSRENATNPSHAHTWLHDVVHKR